MLQIQFWSVVLADAWFEQGECAKPECHGARSLEPNHTEFDGDASVLRQAWGRERSTAPVVGQVSRLVSPVSEVVCNLPQNTHVRSSSTGSARHRFAWPSNQELGQRRSCQVNASAATGGRDRFPMPDVAVGRLGRRRLD